MSGASFTIREASLTDLETIVAFNAALALETEHKQLDAAVLREGVRSAIADRGRCTYFVAELDGIVAGQTMVTFEWSDWRNGWFWWIQSVYVHPDYRRRGVFRALYEHVLAAARARPGVCGIRLYVEEHNDRAQRTYRQMGMAPSGHLVYEVDWSRAGSRE